MAVAIADAVTSCPGVASLSSGELGEVATYLVGRRVIGIRLRDSIEVHVVGRYGTTVDSLAHQIRTAVQQVAPGPEVDVYIDDLDVQLDCTDQGTVGDAGGEQRGAHDRR
jgi:uncharacterized alkaline shock family protein YloU